MRTGLLLAVVLLTNTGCTGRNPFMRRSETGLATISAENSDLKQRNLELQTQNNDLEKKFALTQKELDLVREQLRDNLTRVQNLQTTGEEAQRQLESLRASTRFRGGATITANNSLEKPLRDLGLRDVEVVQKQGVVRVRLPASQVFESNTVRIKAGAYRVLEDVTAAIGKNYPGQTIAIEGHVARGTVDAIRVSAAQARVIYDAVRQSRRNGLQNNRLFIVGMGDIYPLNDRSLADSRRVEFVIYPK